MVNGEVKPIEAEPKGNRVLIARKSMAIGPKLCELSMCRLKVR